MRDKRIEGVVFEMGVREKFDHYIENEFVRPEAGNYLDSINPSDRSVFTKIAAGNSADINKAVSAAKSASIAWADLASIRERQNSFSNWKRTRGSTGEIC